MESSLVNLHISEAHFINRTLFCKYVRYFLERNWNCSTILYREIGIMGESLETSGKYGFYIDETHAKAYALHF